MRLRIPAWGTAVLSVLAATAAHAATIAVPAGGDLQAALDAAQPGDVITLEPNATYRGNFILPKKGGDDNSEYITIRSAAPDAVLPPVGVRITPAYAAYLPKIKSPNGLWALQTATRANHYKLMFLEFQANVGGATDIITIGANDSTQTDLAQVPYAFILDRLYVHGDPEVGQKRGIALHSRDTSVINSWVSDCKGIGQDTQAIGGHNGPGNWLIENNYLEGAGENFLLGGADPPIQNLVTTNVVFRNNHLTKPLAWRDPILATPPNVIAAATPGAGSLPAGTYYYKVVARKPSYQGKTAVSVTSSEVSATLTADGGVTISWTPVATAQDYVVYGRTSNTQNVFWTTAKPYFTDTGEAGSTPKPASGTKWSVKNIFELKNAQDVVIEGNVFENLWVADQPGYPIVFTPRNQSGKAPWVVVQRIMFRNNIVRHTAGGVNILGRDNLAVTQCTPEDRTRCTNNITIVNNLFDDLTAGSWGSARVFQLGDGPYAVTIDHNLAITTQSTIYWLYGGSLATPTPIPNLTITNNMSVHNTYGLNGNNYSTGLKTFNAYMLPNDMLRRGVFCRNVLAGGKASSYTGIPCSGSDNFFPTAAGWPPEFVNFAGGDYHLLPASHYKNVGTDGKDLGPDVDEVMGATAMALSGDVRTLPGMRHVRISPNTLANGMLNVQYEQKISCNDGLGPCAFEVLDSSLPDGIGFDRISGLVAGTPSEPTTGLLTIRAYDTAAPDVNEATAILQTTVDPPELKITVPNVPPAKVGEPFHLAPSVSGALGSVTWSVLVVGDPPDPNLPPGVYLNESSGEITGTPAVWGTRTAIIQAQDSDRWGLNRVAYNTVTTTVAPAPIQIPAALPAGIYRSRYEAALSATGGTGSYKWSVAPGDVPPGLLIDASGLITGEPQCIGSFAMNVQATDAKWPGYAATQTALLDIVAPLLNVSLPVVPAGVIGSPFSLSASATGQVGTVTWSASGLPAGLTMNATGTIVGVPTEFGVFTSVVNALESYSTCGSPEVTRTAAATVTLVIAPLPLAITTGTLPSGDIPRPYRAALQFTGGTGKTTWSIVAGRLPDGTTLSSDGLISGRPTAVGTFSFTVQASDAGWAGNVATRDFSVTIRAREIVLYASDANAIAGVWSLVADATAAGESRLWNPDKSDKAAKKDAPFANPANYFEISFQAEAGVAYHLWIRGKADKDKRKNDAVIVQFSRSVDAAAAPAYRIGTTSGTYVNLADCDGCHLSGWGWQDNGWGVNVMGPEIYFDRPGAQTIRVQVKQDGFSIDQIVLSAERYLAVAPGALKNDATIVAR
jgi:hypothetical protein